RYVKSRILRAAGYEVVEAETGTQALEAVRKLRPALVLLDVQLPDMNGRQVCAQIRANPETANIVVLQVSASHVASSDRIASLDAGADGYIVEPVAPDELIANVRALLRIREAESARQLALEQLREADRRKDEFLAMLAHELRNPLAPIRNAVEILKSDDPHARERARTLVGRQVEHLARLVDDLLEVSRITQRKVVLQPRVVRLADVVESAVETVRGAIGDRRHDLVVDLDDGDTWIEADPVRLAQVIGNLLNNAVKFTPEGGRVALSSRTGPESIEIAVEDNGVGIGGELLPKVFDLFVQADRSLERSQGGLGIGLSLVRGLVEMHGGEVRAESAGPGQGSRFTIFLPLSLRRPPPAAAAEPAAAIAERHRILVVEDNPDSAEAMQMLLETMGHDVKVVGDGQSALEVAVLLQPDVILLDIGLPGMDGYELAQRLRAASQTRAAHIIAVSGYGQEKDRERSLSVGFDVHLVKPVDPAQLSQAIRGGHRA
ncbi:MAG TPA: response regulator, partial [Usitatibacter sp.]|nr:response regulator [Usitatibacter sp.]